MTCTSKNPVLRDVVTYSSGNIYQQILSTLTAIVRPRLLPPAMYGLWNILNLIPTYSSYTHLGSRASMRFLIPRHEARNETEKSREIAGSVFYGSLYLNLLVAAVVLLFVFRGEFSLPVKAGLAVMAVMVLLGWYYEYYLGLLKSYQEFGILAASHMLRASLTFILSLSLIYLFGLYGLFASVVLTAAAVIWYLKSRFRLPPLAPFRAAVFFTLVKNGFPIMVIGLGTALIRSSDFLVISYLLGTESLGYYGVAAMVVRFLMQIPGVSREVTEPRLMQEMTQAPDEQAVEKYFLTPLTTTAYYMPLLIGPVFFLSPLFIRILLPQYLPGILPTQILSLGAFFLSLSYAFRGVIVASNRQFGASLVMFAALAANVSLNILLISLGFGIAGVAAGSSVSFLLLLGGLYAFMTGSSGVISSFGVRSFLGLFRPFGVMCLAILALEYLLGPAAGGGYGTALLELLLFTAVMLFLLRRAADTNPFLKGIDLKSLFREFRRGVRDYGS